MPGIPCTTSTVVPRVRLRVVINGWSRRAVPVLFNTPPPLHKGACVTDVKAAPENYKSYVCVQRYLTDRECRRLRKRRRKPLLCDHCNCFVSNSTYYRHKAKFYAPVSDTCNTTAASESETTSDSEIEFEHQDHGYSAEVSGAPCKCCTANM